MWRRKRIEAKWRAQSEHLGRERVRYLVKTDAINPKVKRLAAEAWLNDSPTCRSEKWDGWDYALLIFGTIAGAFGVLLVLK
jgi:hypothetical protein